MASTPPVFKKPKKEIWTEEDEEIRIGEEGEQGEWEKQEKEILALLDYRTKEVEHLHKRITYYTNQLEEAEKRLEETKSKLVRIRRRCNNDSSTVNKKSMVTGKEVKVEKRSPSPATINGGAKSSRRHEMLDQESESPPLRSKYFSEKTSQSKPLLVIPTVEPKVSHSMRTNESGPRVPSTSDSSPIGPSHSHVDGMVKTKEDRSHKKSPERKLIESQERGTKRKLELKEHKELIPLVCSKSSLSMIRCQTSCMPSQHNRKLKSLILCPANDQLFATSALDGVINLWQVQGRGSSANCLSTSDCGSAKKRRWPEDIAWHPQGNSMFSVYTADGGDSQLSILNLNKTNERMRVTFSEEKPHVKGNINNIMFMPWDDSCFVTGGCDHAVVLWTEKGGENSWKPKALHRSFHTSAVRGVAGLQHKKIVLSAGADKRIIGFDLNSGRADYKNQIDASCMSILTNPRDFNLFMVHTAAAERQIRLFDIRLRQTEIHSFGWKQESNDSQSTLINQCWSPDGLYLTSGSNDPVFHIFDIRYNAHTPSQSIKAHQKRVFKALWHPSLPLIISISSDLNIGMHKLL